MSSNKRICSRIVCGVVILAMLVVFAIMSTSQGVMSGREAWRRKIGGELLCYVW